MFSNFRVNCGIPLETLVFTASNSLAREFSSVLSKVQIKPFLLCCKDIHARSEKNAEMTALQLMFNDTEQKPGR